MLSRTTTDALDHLETWYSTQQWKQRWSQYCQDTLRDIADSLSLDIASLMEKAERDGWHVILSQTIVEHFAELAFEEPPFNATDDYLQRRGWKESREGREYLAAVKNEPFSIYEVLAVKPKEGIMTVQDIIRPCPAFDVQEIAGSREARRMLHLFGKVVPVSGQYHFTGSVFIMKITSALEHTEKIQQAILDQGLLLELDYLPQINSVVRSFWDVLLTDCVRCFFFPFPAFTNVEGHRLLLADIRFPITDLQALILHLDQASDFHRQESEEPAWNWITPPDAKKSLSPAMQDMTSIRASLTVTEQGLKCFADSRERAEMLVDRLKTLLPPDTLGQPMIAYQAPESALSQPGRVKTSESSLPPEVERELIHSLMDKHFKGLLDSPIPMLKDQSPRAASQSPEGQKRIKKWLLYLESQHEQTPGAMTGYDFGWLWEELGVSRV